MKGSRSFLADSLSVLTTRVAVTCATLLTGVILARALGPEGRGAFAALLVVPGFVVAIAELGIRQATVFEVGKAEFAQETIIATLLFLLLITSVCGVAFVGGFFALVPQTSFDALVVGLVCLTVPLQLLTKYFSGFLLGRNEIQEFNRVSWVPAIATLTCTIALVVVLSKGVLGAVLAVVIANGFIGVYAYRLVSQRVKLRVKPHPALAIRMLKLGSIYAASLFVIGLNYRVDILFLERLADLSAVGHYSVAVSLAELIWQIPAAMGVVIFARSANASDRNEFSRKVAALFRLSLLISAVAAVFVAALAPIVIRIVFGEDFAVSAEALRFLLPGIVLMVAHKVLNMDLAGRGRPHVALVSFIPAVIVNVVLNYLWIPSLGITGAALASSVSYAVAVILLVTMYSRITSVTLPQILLPSQYDALMVRQLAVKLRLST